MLKYSLLFALVTLLGAHYCYAYSARADSLIIAEFRQARKEALNHAKVARKLVHQANWAALGTISTNNQIAGFPMVNIISVDDSNINGRSTGKIRFVLTDLDFTGPDWRQKNNVTLLFSDDQNLNCQKRSVDPMEPTCPRTIISGRIIELDTKNPKYNDALAAFIKRHPAANRWMKVHSFYLCELYIENIFVLDFYGGPHTVLPDAYYNVELDQMDDNYYAYVTEK